MTNDQKEARVKAGLYKLTNAKEFAGQAEKSFREAKHANFSERAKTLGEQIDNLIRDVCAETGELYVRQSSDV